MDGLKKYAVWGLIAAGVLFVIYKVTPLKNFFTTPTSPGTN